MFLKKFTHFHQPFHWNIQNCTIFCVKIFKHSNPTCDIIVPTLGLNISKLLLFYEKNNISCVFWKINIRPFHKTYDYFNQQTQVKKDMFLNSVNIKVALKYFLVNTFKIDHIRYFPMCTTLQGIYILTSFFN
jgi:hypothetical protein